MAPGILWAGTTPKNPSTLSDSTFNKWYDNVHLGDVLASGAADFALRYKSTRKEDEIQYTAIYHCPDLGNLSKPEFADIPKTSDLLGGSNDWREELKDDIRAYELIQQFEGPSGKKTRAGGIVTVFMDPAEGTDKDFDDWYRLQHLDMLSMCRGYLRTTRYKLMGDTPFNKRDAGKELPQYLAIHEYETTDFPGDQLKVVVGTEWSKKVIGKSKTFDRHTWSFVSEKSANGGAPML